MSVAFSSHINNLIKSISFFGGYGLTPDLAGVGIAKFQVSYGVGTSIYPSFSASCAINKIEEERKILASTSKITRSLSISIRAYITRVSTSSSFGK